jgi:superfamily I DNA/RNA helicase
MDWTGNVARLIDRLNPPQREAVLATEGPVLVLAGAGSGKTRVITCRIAHLLNRGVAPASILAVSFTNKAAGEMRERVTDMVGRAGRDCQLSTFHALGVKFLRAEHEAVGLQSGFGVLDEGDQIDAARTALRALGYDLERYEPRAVLQRVSHWKGLLTTPAPPFVHPLDAVVAQVLAPYQQRLRAMNGCDFDDLIGLPVQALESDPAVAARWSHRFRYVMVDEYQDTNGAQLRFLQGLIAGHRNLCVVGDDDQSIYAWRGAVAGNILDFGRQFPGARIIALTQNYRSTNSVLRCANAVIGHNADRHEKSLWSDQGDGERVRYHQAEHDEAEAAWIASDLIHLKHAHRAKWSDFGVLYRTNSQSRALEDGIRRAGVPYRIVGGTKFYDRKEIRDVVAWLRVIANPFDEAAFRRVVAVPPRGIGDTSLERLGVWARKNEVPFFKAVRQCAQIEGIGPRVRDALHTLDALLHEYRGLFQSQPPVDACRALIEDRRIGFPDECVRTSKDARETQKRFENVREIPNSLAVFLGRNPEATLEDFLAQLSLDTRREDDADAGRDEVALLTLHSAKGLEFEYVYFVGLEEGLLPHKRVLAEGGDVSEERRLCYVGITRARKLLTLTGARVRLNFGKIERRRQSRFLLEIPEALLDGGYAGTPGPLPEALRERTVADAFAEIDELLK